jgi:type IV secretion system protein TrbL
MNPIEKIVSAQYTLLDRPLTDAIAYFAGAMRGFFMLAMTLALVFGAVGIIWNCFRLWFGTAQVRKVCIGIIANFLIFTGLVYAYPRIVNGVMDVSLRIGMSAGNGYLKINGAFQALKLDSENRQKAASATIGKIIKDASGPVALSEDTFKKIASSSVLPDEELRRILQENDVRIYSNTDISNAGYFQSNGSTAGNVIAAIGNFFLPSRELERIKAEQQNFNRDVKSGVEKELKSKSLAQAMVTLKAINEVLSEVNEDRPDGSRVSTYLYDPFLRDSRGNSLGILSPGAMIKTSVLIADIINRQGAYSYDENSKNFIEQTVETIKNLNQFIVSSILKVLMTFGIIFAGIIFVMQYVVCIIEYYIVSSIGMLLIPCVLFDAAKDYAKKLISLFAAYFLKIIVMSLCTFWAFSCFISMGNDIIGSNQPISFLSFSNFAFTCLLCWTVVTKMPQIAQGLVSGSPSMSMNDFMGAAGMAAGVVASAGGKLKNTVSAPGKMADGINRNFARVSKLKENAGKVKNLFSSSKDKPSGGKGTAKDGASKNSKGGTSGSSPLYSTNLQFTDQQGSSGGKSAGGMASNKQGASYSGSKAPGPLTDAQNSASSRQSAENFGADSKQEEKQTP